MWKKCRPWLLFAGFLVLLLGIEYYSQVLVLRNAAGSPAIVKIYRAVLAGADVVIVLAGYFFFFHKKRPSLEISAALIMLVLGLFYMTVLPPFSSSDEQGHFMAAYAVSNRILGKAPYAEDGTVMVREEDLFTEDGDMNAPRLSKYASKEDFRFVAETLLRRTDKTGMVPADYNDPNYEKQQMIMYFSTELAHLPQALGLALGRLLGFSYVTVIYLSRLGGLAFFTAMLYLAMKLMPRGKLTLAAAALLPMAIMIDASCSYDVLLNGLSLVFIAYTFRLKEQDKTITIGQSVGMVLLLLLLTPWKMNMCVMALLCLIIPKSKFRSSRHYYLCIGAAAAAILLGTLLVNWSAVWAILSGDSGMNYAQDESYSYTLSYLLTHPVKLAKLFFCTLLDQGDFYFITMVGQYPGSLDMAIGIYTSLIVVFSVLAALCGVRVVGEEPVYDRRTGVIALMVIGVMIAVTELAMAVGWTPNTSDVIQGVQGRYYLCILPLVLLLIQKTGLTVKKDISYPLLFGILVTNVLTFMRIMERISYR